MAFALLIIGAVLLISGVRNTTDGPNGLFTLVKGDFTGQSNFIYWTVAILLIGSIGLIDKLKPISTGLLTLVIVVLVLTRGNPSGIGGGFFQQFTQGIASTTTPQATVQNPAYQGPGASTPGFNQPGSVINEVPLQSSPTLGTGFGIGPA